VSEHRVDVTNGEYTFVAADGDCPEIDILRRGCPWMGHPLGNRAIRAAMRELDAARLVVQAVRAYAGAPAHRVPPSITAALRRHDELIVDRSPPSSWALAASGDHQGAESHCGQRGWSGRGFHACPGPPGESQF
jgi:hypothetical protein